jgi:hypothetical protein
MKHYESLNDALNDLREKGYTADFARDTVCLYCGELDIRLDPEEFHVDEVYRIDGNAGSGSASLLYAITATSGVKGTLTGSDDAYVERLDFDRTKTTA